MKGKLKSTEYNLRQAETALLSRKLENTTETLIDDKIDYEVVSGEEQQQDGQRLLYRDVHGTTDYEAVTGTLSKNRSSKGKTQLESFVKRDEAGNIPIDSASNLMVMVEDIYHGIMSGTSGKVNRVMKNISQSYLNSFIVVVLEAVSTGKHKLGW